MLANTGVSLTTLTIQQKETKWLRLKIPAARFRTQTFFRELFRDSQVSDMRQPEWQHAVRHAGRGTPPLRFPVYEHLYQFNLCTQKMVESLEERQLRNTKNVALELARSGCWFGRPRRGWRFC